jgi:hypothetical protein
MKLLRGGRVGRSAKSSSKTRFDPGAPAGFPFASLGSGLRRHIDCYLKLFYFNR